MCRASSAIHNSTSSLSSGADLFFEPLQARRGEADREHPQLEDAMKLMKTLFLCFGLSVMLATAVHVDAGTNASAATAQDEGDSNRPSPAGRVYEVMLSGDFTEPDCWHFGIDGTFRSEIFGVGDWQVLVRRRRVAIWNALIGGGLIFTDIDGMTFPASGQNLNASGLWFVDPFGLTFTATGVENPACVVTDARPASAER
jgi:hypothetical protein